MAEIPNNASEAIKQCDRDIYPNIYILLQIACTIPATSCECERSASALKRLNTYLRASVGQERLTGVALINIHYDTIISRDEIIDKFAKKHPRRLQFRSLLTDRLNHYLQFTY